MKSLIIGYIASSLESGVLRNLFIEALRKLVAKTSNTVDDTIVDIIEIGLTNQQIDDKIKNGLKELVDSAKADTNK